jgi:hypothetical protein
VLRTLTNRYGDEQTQKVEATAIMKMAGTTSAQFTCERSSETGQNDRDKSVDHAKENCTARLGQHQQLQEMGASSKRSKSVSFLEVTVTDNREVVPNKTEMAITPGSRVSMLSRPLPDRIKNIPVQAIGKINPQLMLGGLR